MIIMEKYAAIFQPFFKIRTILADTQMQTLLMQGDSVMTIPELQSNSPVLKVHRL